MKPKKLCKQAKGPATWIAWNHRHTCTRRNPRIAHVPNQRAHPTNERTSTCPRAAPKLRRRIANVRRGDRRDRRNRTRREWENLPNRLISCGKDVHAVASASFDLVDERLRALGVITPSEAHPCRGYASNDQCGQRAGQGHGLEQEEFRREVQQSNHKRRQCGTWDRNRGTSGPSPTPATRAEATHDIDDARFDPSSSCARTVDCRTADIACTNNAKHAGHTGPCGKGPTVKIGDLVRRQREQIGAELLHLEQAHVHGEQPQSRRQVQPSLQQRGGVRHGRARCHVHDSCSTKTSSKSRARRFAAPTRRG
mmetsp:Transcript_5953/g.20992  ORF Transcript_5953/g.20992 Transcript_5953/m.20992 type:complete len:310 (-) Transcript_5953:118-1047(-)